MCGLVFVYNDDVDTAVLAGRVRAATRRISHRGPDGEGLEAGTSWAIGHRRLAIIDIEGSPQPMTDPGRRYWLVFNGEIYNYRELRQGLDRDWGFRTRGDTEVVLAGLVLRGLSFLREMEGMWALALWDSVECRLTLCRDRMGKKPLYYQAGQHAVACASELPALAEVAVGPWAEDIDSTADFLRYGFYLPGTTAYQDVKEVLPGRVLSWSPRTGCTESSYWQLRVGGYAGTRADAATTLRELLVSAVRRRLVADVEVGAFLSGGVDSSLVVGIMARELGVHPKTFTIGFDDRSYDEREFARLVSGQFGTTHFEAKLEHWDSAELTGLVLDHVGQPFGDSSLLPTAAVSRIAASKVKVVLSGDGGDELFSGYQRYLARTFLRWYTRLPVQVRAKGERLLSRLPEPMAHHSHSLLKKAHLFSDISARQRAETPYVAPVQYSLQQFRHLAPELSERGHSLPGIPQTTEEDDITRMMTADALVYLPQDILTKVDRATMAHSLEARAPFLDRQVVELAFSLPRAWHRERFEGKRMLRAAFPDLLPSVIWKRRKQGFAVPVHAWFRGEMGASLHSHLEQSGLPVQTQAVRDLLREHRSGRRDHGYRLWTLYTYLLWRERSVPVVGSARVDQYTAVAANS